MRYVIFIARRILHSIFVLLGLSIVIFVISRVMPGDPARVAVGARAPQWVVDSLREQMHLNDSLPVQYVYWLRDAVQGDFGLSLVTQRPVADDVREFLPASLELVFFAGMMPASSASAWASSRPATKTPGSTTWCASSPTPAS